MKIIFKSLVKQPNVEDTHVNIEVQANCETFVDDKLNEWKIFTFKESENDIAVRFEISTNKLRIYRDNASLIFELGVKNHNSTIDTSSKTFIPITTLLKSIDFEKNKANYELYIQNKESNSEVLISECFVELEIKK
ncbi:hypothetical protein [Mycoplasma tauri]|uniref:DUF1934 domain-containing protein n=1 Tax=Mycoplasma tauri TaxID=547987 RepID=A0A953ND75_9MOLU|nr:hypothetical protein [Mycoplasma tauri]MBZ4195440.1 hypothetical protein [Mycoplasma tauri]MBZ4203565.1 hypothetical protein [Mycoplasma tauri]MBZ4204368.1 hypothetical protein [Mycoplasma tauri]MBZ4212635.1 hypothetical protein [Mycoplasma tauri]MBZ4218455.1 hypothetical protein [Mycoplasma tauri]